MASRFDDIDLPSAVKYLIASDPNLQVLGAAYLQHKCYSDSNAKKQVGTRGGGSPEPLRYGGANLGGWRKWREPQTPWEVVLASPPNLFPIVGSQPPGHAQAGEAL